MPPPTNATTAADITFQFSERNVVKSCMPAPWKLQSTSIPKSEYVHERVKPQAASRRSYLVITQLGYKSAQPVDDQNKQKSAATDGSNLPR
jgi:hypothetical protein